MLPIDYFLGHLVVCAQCVDLCMMYRGWDIYKLWRNVVCCLGEWSN